ncbi:MAG TPA: hypothetical protein VGD37_15535 [Kofleriaceae bacterium]|jgi:hypothetical protein
MSVRIGNASSVVLALTDTDGKPYRLVIYTAELQGDAATSA